eukprot:531104-Pelagomonas_calceolata.AAC.1
MRLNLKWQGVSPASITSCFNTARALPLVPGFLGHLDLKKRHRYQATHCIKIVFGCVNKCRALALGQVRWKDVVRVVATEAAAGGLIVQEEVHSGSASASARVHALPSVQVPQ